MMLKHLRTMDRDELLDALGLQRKPSIWAMTLPFIGIAAAGMVVGAAVAFMLAPKSGRELRDEFRDKLDSAAGRMKQRMSRAAREEGMTGAGSTLPETGAETRRF